MLRCFTQACTVWRVIPQVWVWPMVMGVASSCFVDRSVSLSAGAIFAAIARSGERAK